MKTISFSAVEILPKLLSKEKTQTIRPLFCNLTYCHENVSESSKHHSHKPRFKVGEKVRLYWKMRSKHKIFCSKCGNHLSKPEEGHYYECGKDRIFFDKILGEVEITEVRELKLSKTNGRFGINISAENDTLGTEEWGYGDKNEDICDAEELAKLDGFNSYEEMCQWFDKKYDLQTPKKFIVYRWRWL